jgi:hypothetical protein
MMKVLILHRPGAEEEQGRCGKKGDIGSMEG